MFDVLIVLAMTLVGVIICVLFWWKAKDRPAVASLFQAVASIILAGITCIYVAEIRRQGAVPLVGVTNVQTGKVLKDKNVDTYDGTAGAGVVFAIENTGSRPAKRFKIRTVGKIGKTILPYTEDDDEKGAVIFPGVKTFNKAGISKEILDKLTAGNERLKYKVQISYFDWEEKKYYEYSQFFEVLVSQKDPLQLEVKLASSF